MLRQGAVDDELLYLEPVQTPPVFRRRLEERPLVTLEVDRHAESEHGQRLEALGVQELDPDVGVAVGLGN